MAVWTDVCAILLALLAGSSSVVWAFRNKVGQGWVDKVRSASRWILPLDFCAMVVWVISGAIYFSSGWLRWTLVVLVAALVLVVVLVTCIFLCGLWAKKKEGSTMWETLREFLSGERPPSELEQSDHRHDKE
jgi:small-conductance mechanosensitive channel